MNIYLFPTDTNFTSRKSTAAKKVARKLAGFSKKTVTPPQQSEVKINYMPQQPKVLQAAALTTLATAPVAFQEALKSNWFKLSAGCEPDIFQKSAGINLIKGEDVLVTAPTGTGKTAIAHFAINKNLNQGKRTLYTTPLKALSNEKFRDFQKIYGEENVGILTGDVKINPEAPIVIMTTEIYRNMVFNQCMDSFVEDTLGLKNPTSHNGLKDVNTVIFDELHYLGDVDRGGIWEQSIMFTPPEVQMLSLSATIGNNAKINNWMASIKGQGSKFISFLKNNADDISVNEGIKAVRTTDTKTVLIDVPKENRHVPLEFVIHQGEVSGRKMPKDAQKIERRKAKKEAQNNAQSISAKVNKATFSRLVDDLCEADRLPAIIFIFSKSFSQRVLDELKTKCECLNNKDEIRQINETIKRYEMEGRYLGEGLDKEALIRGYAIHNAGMLPVQKELVEELFQRKLVKVVIATETLAAGINMPARTTVISAIRKPSDHPDAEDGMRMLSPNDFHQMAGRAGRRGIDDVGYCYAIGCNAKQKSVIKNLIQAGANNLKSNFVPDYSFLASYYDKCQDDTKLKTMMSNSLYAYDTNPEIAMKKQDKLFEQIEARKEVMQKLHFLDKDNNLTKKGELLKHLNGYVQLPVIEFLTNDTLLDLSPIQLAGFLGAIANMEVVNAEENDDVRDNSSIEIPDKLLKAELKLLRQYLREYTAATGEQVEVDTDVAQNIYRFAELNSQPGENSVNNWSYMYNYDPYSNIDYEGQLFRQITTTLDLMKQLYSIIDEELAGRTETYAQAARLKQNLYEAMQLINQEPVKI